MQILCPFHDDHTPSLNVHVGYKITPGSFHCFSCGAKGFWNKLAYALRLEKVEVEKTSKTVNGKVYDDADDPFKLLAEELKHKPILKEEKYRTLKGTEVIPNKFSWRGLPGAFYRNLGGSFYWTETVEYLYFPLTVHSEYRGYTLLAVKSHTDKFTKYQIFAEAKKVFFLYDALPQNETIVLTEGHFDALRLISEGFFAAAVLGVKNWSDTKKELLIAKNPRKIIIAFDGDAPGYEASIKIFEDLANGSDVDIFYLPLQTPKLDPGDMSQDYLDLLWEKINGRDKVS